MPKPPKKRVDKRKRWKPADIERAAIRYCIEGTVLAVEREEHIPETTIRGWRDNSPVWAAATEAYRDQNNDRFISRANAIIDKATDVTLEKLPEATAQQAATIGAIYYDKQRLALQLPGSYTAKTETMTDLAKQFQALARDIKAKTVQVIDITPDKAPLKDPGRGQK